METKHCPRCDTVKLLDDFGRHKSRSDGRQAYCKACSRAARQASTAKNAARTEVSSPSAKMCARCGQTKPAGDFYKDRRRADGLYANCKLCHYKITHQWQKKNPVAVRAIQQRSYANNAEAKRAAAVAYYWANWQSSRARHTAWKLVNRAHATALETVRRARKLGAPGTATPEQIAARVAYYGWRCWMCGGPWEQIDHVKPIRAGGPNWPANLRPACASCNGRKNGTWPYPLR